MTQLTSHQLGVHAERKRPDLSLSHFDLPLRAVTYHSHRMHVLTQRSCGAWLSSRPSLRVDISVILHRASARGRRRFIGNWWSRWIYEAIGSPRGVPRPRCRMFGPTCVDRYVAAAPKQIEAGTNSGLGTARRMPSRTFDPCVWIVAVDQPEIARQQVRHSART